MIDIQTVLTYLTLISIPVGVFYHITTLRNAEKARSTQLATYVSNKLQDLREAK
jgi:hypothetical protein